MSFLGDNRSFVIRRRDGADCLNRIPERDGDELNLASRLSPEQVAARETFTLPIPSRNPFMQRQPLVAFVQDRPCELCLNGGRSHTRPH